jgi:hypothetical protein
MRATRQCDGRRIVAWQHIGTGLDQSLTLPLPVALVFTPWRPHGRIKKIKVTLDVATHCPTTGPTLVQVLLFDRSDPISGQQARRIRQVVHQLRSAAQFGTRFDIYTFDGDEKWVLAPQLTICSPERAEEANAIIENPDLIRRRYEAQFSAVLDRSLDALLEVSTRPNSPIIESLKAAATSSFGELEGRPIPRYVLPIAKPKAKLPTRFGMWTEQQQILSRKRSRRTEHMLNH